MISALLAATTVAAASAHPAGMRLTRWHGEGSPVWMSEESINAKAQLVGKWPRFMDLTDSKVFNVSALKAAESPIPTAQPTPTR